MKTNQKQKDRIAELDRLIEAVTTDAYGEDEQLWALRQVIEDAVALPADAAVIGEPVEVMEVDYDGNVRRGLTTRCRRQDGTVYTLSAADVVFPEASPGARYLAAYRRWLGLDPFAGMQPPPKPPKAAADDIDLGTTVELIALAVKERGIRCRLPGSERVVTLRAAIRMDLVPGQILTVVPRKQWRYAGHPYLSGDIESTRIDVGALGLVPLGLTEIGLWDPDEQYWGEPENPIEAWTEPIIARGPLPEFKMEQVLPGEDVEDPGSDPITRAAELYDAGERGEARKLLMGLCQSDLRCLDAHADLGHLAFDYVPEAIGHFEVGYRIGALSLGDRFDGVLPWELVDNRPFLRCMYGYGVCLWRLGRFDEALPIFERLRSLNPADNQRMRFVIGDVRAKKAWKA